MGKTTGFSKIAAAITVVIMLTPALNFTLNFVIRDAAAAGNVHNIDKDTFQLLNSFLTKYEVPPQHILKIKTDNA